jgi:glutamate formiminotransferase/formiminotetrahydrofolate cyclodeaminase
MKIVECVPNFSEGRDMTIIDKITAEIKAVPGARLLDVDPGADTNRTVVTFIGDPAAVKEAAFRVVKKAAELIDMSKHKGEHPRMGATDVCPFIPVSGVTMEECVEIARAVGKRIGEELAFPVYLYEYAASSEERRNLANVRSGEYEGLQEKLKDPHWKPDFGPAKFNPRTGATAVGARDFLIAYNVNLNTTDAKLAHEIATTIRESGKKKRDENGKFAKDKDGNAVTEPGLLKNCKAVGWYIDTYEAAQISINLTNYHVTPPHMAFDTVSDLAGKMGMRVTGSELVGLIPLEAILQAGNYYLEKQGKSRGIPERQVIKAAIRSLGLREVAEFDIDKKIIEYQARQRDKALVDMTCADFTDELSTDSPAPGGGSVAALCGALSSALSAMVGNLTFSKKQYKNVWPEVEQIAIESQALKDAFLRAVDDDTDAFNKVMDCFKMPKGTPEEKTARDEAVQEATKNATLVPFNVLEKSVRAAELAKRIAEIGNQNSLSDAGVAGLTARTAAIGAYYNVLINLQSITDKEFVKKTFEDAEKLKDQAVSITDEIQSSVCGTLKNALNKSES